MCCPWSLLQIEQPQVSWSFSNKGRCSIPLMISVAFLWAHCNRSIHVFLCKRPQSWMQCYRWDLTRAEQGGRITSLHLLVMFPIFSYSSGYTWFSGMQVYTVNSYLIFCLQKSHGTILKSIVILYIYAARVLI